MGGASTKVKAIDAGAAQSATALALKLEELTNKFASISGELQKEKTKNTALSASFASARANLEAEQQKANKWQSLYNSVAQDAANSTALKQLTDQIQTLSDENFKLNKRIELIGAEFKRPVLLWLTSLSMKYAEPALDLAESTILTPAIRSNILRAMCRITILDAVGDIGKGAETVLPTAIFDRLIDQTEPDAFIKYLPAFFQLAGE